MNCKVCGNPLIQENYTKKQWNYKNEMFRKQGYVYCSKECSGIYHKKISSETMSKTNKKYASERMRRNNPTLNPEVRAKISAKRKGHAPTDRRGNGAGLTVPQEALLNALSEFEPIPEYAIATHKPKGGEYPQSYKPDIAIPEHMIAIEVDGASHHLHTRKIEDVKKDSLLTSLGWKVLRFWNAEIMENLDLCVQSIVSEIKRGMPYEPKTIPD